MNSKRWAALGVAVVLFFISVFYQFSVSRSDEGGYEALLGDSEFKEKVIRAGKTPLSPTIVVLNLEGIILDVGDIGFMSPTGYNHRQFLKMIEQAGEDDRVEGIILRVNSPGGGVVESAEVYDKLLEVRESTNKPIYVSMGNTAASGGYYVSAPADKIVAHPGTVTGSIGVIMESINYAELAEDIGIDFNTITSGEFKDIMSSSRPMTEEEEAILQSIVDEMYDDFVQAIVNGRGMSEADVRKVADGRIYTGKQAKEVGLVDELGTLDDTIALLEEDHGLKGANVVEYEMGFDVFQLFGFTAKNLFQKDTDLHSLINLIRDTSGPRAMYLYSR